MLENAGIEENSPEAERFFKDNNEFMPTVQTPILNFLHFLTEEYDDVVVDMENLRQQYLNTYRDVNADIKKATVDMSQLHKIETGNLKDLYEKTGDIEEMFDTDEEVPHMESYIYKNMDAGTFGKLKKLKALSYSDNEQEAHAAWTKCIEICKKFNLDFESIPCKVTD
jgi:hypothetical protein